MSGTGESAAGDAIGRADSNPREGACMRTHSSADAESYSKPIPDILSIIKDSYDELRPAERRVADVVLADVTFAVDASNAEIAQRADVSEPTVTRFCRAIGCDGVRDFKLKLAQSVVVGRLYLAPGEPMPPTTDGVAALERRLRRGAQRPCRSRAQRRSGRYPEGRRAGRRRPAGGHLRARRQFHGAGAGNAEPAVPLRRRQRSRTPTPTCSR